MRMRWILTLLLLLTSTSLPGQVQTGTLDLYVFGPDGLGLAGVSLEADGRRWTTDAEGRLSAALAPGPRDLTLTRDGQSIGGFSTVIRAGQVAESLINLKGGQTSEPAAPEAPAAAAEPAGPVVLGVLEGVVVHFETRKPVEGATILVRGTDREARTNAQGRFRLDVPMGTRTLSVIHPLFATQTVAELSVSAATKPIEVELTPTALQLDSVAVFSASEVMVQGGVSALVEEVKNSSVVLNLLGSEQISRTGDSDAAQALGRVTGLTVVDGKSVYVRGMGDRYASSLLNGARLPSPETDKRVVPLDLFPTAVLESLAIQKTYGPDLYGDFGGGAVSLRTIGVPDDRYKRRLRGSVSFSLGFDLETLFQTKNLSRGGALDWLGVDDGTRALPAPVLKLGAPLAEFNPLTGVGSTADELTEAGKAFKNNWGADTVLFLPNPSLTFTLRDQYDFPLDRRLGWSFASLLKHSLSEDTQSNLTFGNPQGTSVTQDMKLNSVSRDVDAGALINWEYEDPAWLKFESTTFGTRLTTQDRTVARGQDKELPEAILYETSWVEQTLVNQRILSQFRLPGGLGTSLQYSVSWARRYEPDHMYVGYGRESPSDPFTTNERVGRPYRLFTNVEDLIHDASWKLTVPLAGLGWGDHSLELGAQGIRQDRNASTRRFTFKMNPDSEADPGSLFLPEFIGVATTSPVKFSESTLSTDQYKADHSVVGGYFNLDLLLFDGVRTTLGTRAEWSRQSVFTFDLFSGKGSQALVDTVDLLPVFNLTVPLNSRWQVRVGGSRTVNRPDLRELSKAPKDGLPGQGQFVGNPNLKRAVILAGDLRLENYLTPTETWSVGVFYKDFTDAIELFQEAGAGGIKTPVNVPKAFNLGAELEWNLTLAGVADLMRTLNAGRKTGSMEEFWSLRQSLMLWGNLWRDLTLSGNFAWIHSQIDYQGRPPGVTTSSVRPLQGQSPYVLNLSLTYKNSLSWDLRVKSDTQVTVSYNLFGPRIVKLGIEGYADSYEQAFHQLDLTVKHRFDEFWVADFKAKNLLDLPATIRQGSQVIEEQLKGRSYSVGVKYEF